MRTLQIIAILAFLLLSLHSGAQSNDHIFPAADVAKKYIDFDSKGFIINGKRIFLVSAGMEYARVPRALWTDRLQRLKMAGFNCVEIYTFWNFHEPQEGKFSFSGEHDLNAFLQLVHSMDMYCIARVGPYYCAEWDFGGYPVWLRFKDGLKVREPNVVFEKCVNHFFDTLMPIVCRNQINHGGAVIMVQLENEHPLGWGTAMPNSYFAHLRSYTLSKGLQVPYFFSGLHHSSDPAGDGKTDDDKRPNPWFSTEFWSVWYNGYSSGEKEAGTYARRTWKIIAGGGGGYNYYMAHGGSNFGYTNNDEDAASYDYGSAVGQAGDLRPMYYAMKKAALFAGSFEDIVANSINEPVKDVSIKEDSSSTKFTVRKSSTGNILFINNLNDTPVKVGCMGRSISLKGNEIFPVINHYHLTPDVTINWSFARIYSLFKQGSTTNIIISGDAGEPVEIEFLTKKIASEHMKQLVFTIKKDFVDFQSLIPTNGYPKDYAFQCGTKTIRIICLSNKLADRTWLFTKNNQTYIVSGPSYVSDIKLTGNNIRVTAEQPWQSDTSSAWLFTKKSVVKLHQSSSSNTHLTSLSLSPWQYKKAAQPAAIDYDDSQWLRSHNPMQMGADGDTTFDAWYRTIINIPKDGTYTLQADGGGRATTFIDGVSAGSWDIQDGGTKLFLTKGKHLLSFFTAHDGRDKLAAYIGAIDSTDSKGLYGEVRLLPGNNTMQTLQGWKYQIMPGKEAVNNRIPTDTTGWKPYTIGQDVFDKKKGFAWFQTRLSLDNYKAGKAVLFFKSVDENATVFINNQQVAKHEGWNQKFYVTLTHLDTLKAPLYLNVFIENYDNEGGIDQPVKLNLIPDDAITVTNWRMKGGTGNPFIGAWSSVNDTGTIEGPCFYQSQFTINASALEGTIWRVQTTGLGHGSVWVNGHNLGRYPEKVPAPGMYIPECWLHTGGNKILIYDEDGKAPQKISLQSEAAASRDIIQFTAQLPNN